MTHSEASDKQPDPQDLLVVQHDAMRRGIDYHDRGELSGKALIAGFMTVVIGGFALGAYSIHKYNNEHSAEHTPTVPGPASASSSEAPPSQSIMQSPNEASSTTRAATSSSTAAPSPDRSPTSTALSSPNTTSVAVSPPLDASSETYKVAQNMIVGFDVSKMSFAEMRKFMLATHVGGCFLIETSNGNSLYRKLSRLPGHPLIASDEEGGLVHRLSYDGTPNPSASELSSMRPEQIKRIAEDEAKVMRASGVTLDLGPVLDLDNGQSNGAISGLGRSFGKTPDAVIQDSDAFIAGLRNGGIRTTAKHFPGLGNAQPDSNTDSHPATTSPLSQLEGKDLLPFQNDMTGSKVDAVMVGNQIVPGLESPGQEANIPASINPAAYKLARDLGFTGMTTTDDLNSISKYDGSSEEQNIVAADTAGADAPLFTIDSNKSLQANVNMVNAAIADIARTVPASQIDQSYARVSLVKQG